MLIEPVETEDCVIFQVHKSPYLFEVCLWHPVVEEVSSCKVINDEIVFQLVKRDVEPWPSLAAELTRPEVQQVKLKAIEEAQAKAEKRRKENAGKSDT